MSHGTPDEYEYDITHGKDEAMVYRAPAFRVSHGTLVIPPETIEDDEPILPTVYLELRREDEEDGDALLIVMAPHAHCNSART